MVTDTLTSYAQVDFKLFRFNDVYNGGLHERSYYCSLRWFEVG